MNKKSILWWGIILSTSLLAIIFAVITFSKKQDNDIDEGSTSIEETLSDEQKEILNINDTKDEDEHKKQHEEQLEESRTDEYKEYAKLNDEEKAQYDVIPREFTVPNETLDEIIESQETDESLPSYYTLADHINLHISNQGDYGLCWAFASLTAVETFAQLHGYGEYNLSEIQLDYLSSNKMYGDRTPHSGGSMDLLKKYSSMGLSPVNEQPNEYSDKTDDEILSYFNSEPVFDEITTVSFPALDKATATDEEISRFRNAVKRHIIKNGALYSVTKGTPLENANNTQNSSPNHAMAIVGWDDNYPASRWSDINGESNRTVYSQGQEKPTHDGAYILQDSYGEQNGKDGYVYVYYDDYWIERYIAGVTSLEFDESNYVNLADLQNENIKNYIRNNYDLYVREHNGQEIIPKTALEHQYFDFSNMELSDDDVKQVISLFSDSDFVLNDNKITSISSLSGLNSTFIDLSGNPIKTIEGIRDETKSFICNSCQLSGEIDLSGTNLSVISLSNNKDISSYKFPETAEIISISDNNLSEIDLSYLENITSLNLSNNPNLSDLTKLPRQIDSLLISGTGITDFSAFGGVQISSISAGNLPTLTSINGVPNTLRSLDISNNPQINDYSALSTIQSNLSLNISNNNLSSIEFLNNYLGPDFVLTLNASNNAITEIPSFSYKVSTLDLSNNKIESGLENINEGINLLTLEHNNISDISNLPVNNSVDTLNIRNNPVSNLSNLNNLKALKYLSIGNKDTELSGTIESSLSFLSIDSADITNLKFLNANSAIALHNATAIDHNTLSENLRLKNGIFKAITIDGIPTNDFSLYALLSDNISDYNLDNTKRYLNVIATDCALTNEQQEELINARKNSYTLDKNVSILGEPLVLDADGVYHAKSLAERNIILTLYSAFFDFRAKDGSYVKFTDSIDSVSEKNFYPLYGTRGDTYWSVRKIKRN